MKFFFAQKYENSDFFVGLNWTIFDFLRHSCLVFIFTTSSAAVPEDFDTSVEATNKGI